MKIILRLKGGIGNQLFQRLFASSLCKKLDAELIFDLSYYSVDAYGRSPLQDLVVADGVVGHASQFAGAGCFLLREGDVKSLEQIQRLPEEVACLVLDGYWQSELLFQGSVARSLYGDIERRALAGVQNSGDFRQISSSQNAVSIHVRRGDYGHMGHCRASYYKAAIHHLEQNYPDLELFFFTDEPNYTLHLAGALGKKYNLVRSGDDLSDLYLMSLCRHHVLANSTFSWWGAWFAERHGGVIICPSEWVTIGGVTSPCPTRWIHVKNSVDAFVLDESHSRSSIIDIQRQRFRAAINAWFADRGDFTLRVNFDGINPDSVVFDLGGYKGDWTAAINSRYAPRLFVFEPIIVYWKGICERFKTSENVACLNLALGSEDGEAVMSLSGDGSGEFAGGDSHERVSVRGVVGFLTECGFEKIDLMKVNIEGGEFALLERLVSSGYISRFKRIQVQFHDFVPDAIAKRASIVSDLQRTHRQVWCYYFVWEEWVILD
jgi:FkbM family methyltransferase